MMTIFYGFEVRSGVARSGQQPTKTPKEEAEEAAADYSKDYKDWRVGSWYKWLAPTSCK